MNKNNNEEQLMEEKLIKQKEVLNLIKWSRTTIWRRIKAGTFPKPTKRGGTRFWKLSAIKKFIDED